jgi:L-2,4-diaminobutyric acid acetyltransferase
MTSESAAVMTGQAPRKSTFNFRAPSAEDGPAIAELIEACPPLDTNSLYCNLLQCSHFADTCILAEQDGMPRGWISGYQVPDEPDTLFIWQVAVHESARGEGLAKRLIGKLLDRLAPRGITRLKTTITPGNEGSWALFRAVARERNAPLGEDAWFKRDVHFGGEHDTEHLVTIGPFGAADGR